MDNRAFQSSSQEVNMADTKNTLELDDLRLRKNSKQTNSNGGRKRYCPLKFGGHLKPRSFTIDCWLLTFYQTLSWNIRSRLNSSTFWVFRPAFRYVWSKLKLCAENEDFDQTYLNTGSKKELGLARYSIIISGKISKAKIWVKNSL